MHLVRTAARIFVAGVIIAASTAAQAQYRNMNCNELWVERNSFYKEKGFCFKTQRGISFFGNAGCKYDDVRDVPVSSSERGQISAIVAAERAKGCN